jgi:hypothetical protein
VAGKTSEAVRATELAIQRLIAVLAAQDAAIKMEEGVRQ